MQVKYWAMLAMVGAAMLGAVAQVVLKSAGVQFNLSAVTNWRLWLFACLYGIGVIINIVAYRYGEASVLYPMIAMSYLYTVLLAWIFLGESLTVMKVTGSLTVVIGVAMIALS